MRLDPDVIRAALVAATALHLGFQLTVTLVVYPALARTPADAWTVRHASHSRSITPLVGIVYSALLLACAAALLLDRGDPGVWIAAGAALATVVVTGAVAAPLHGRLGEVGPDPALLTRLLAADRIRTALAAVATVGAVLHAAG